MVWLGGQLVTSPRPTFGMSFQNPVLLEWRSILQNVILPLEIVAPRMPRKDKEERARSHLSLVGLEGFEDKRPSELSGGMRQRASLCRAIVHRPEVLILDEPFGALDAISRTQIRHDLEMLWLDTGKTVLFITHSIEEAIGLSDRVLVMSKGPGTIIDEIRIELPRPRPAYLGEYPEFSASEFELVCYQALPRFELSPLCNSRMGLCVSWATYGGRCLLQVYQTFLLHCACLPRSKYSCSKPGQSTVPSLLT